jgi:hypothetical protein
VPAPSERSATTMDPADVDRFGLAPAIMLTALIRVRHR